MKRALNERQKRYIRKHAATRMGTDIAKSLGVSKSAVNAFTRKEGIGIDKATMHKLRGARARKPFTKKEDAYISRRIRHASIKAIAREMGRTAQMVSVRAKELGFADLIVQKALDSRIKPGTIPGNKGKRLADYMSPETIARTAASRFQKGHLPVNTKERDGVITIRTDHAKRGGGHQYKWIRVSLGQWVPYHKYRWEKYRGPIPRGYCLWFKDGNTLNVRLQNLELITRQENLRRNRMNYLNMPPELRKATKLLKQLNETIYGKEQTK